MRGGLIMVDMNKQDMILIDEQFVLVGLFMMGMDDVVIVIGVISVGVVWDVMGGGCGKVVFKFFGVVGFDFDVVVVFIQDGDLIVLCVGWDENYKNLLYGQFGDGLVIYMGDVIIGNEVQDGDDEVVIVDFDKVFVEFEVIVIEVVVFKKKNKMKGDQGFQGVVNVLFIVYNGCFEQKDKQFCIWLLLVGKENCVIVCVLICVKDGQGCLIIMWELCKWKICVYVEYGNVVVFINVVIVVFMVQQCYWLFVLYRIEWFVFLEVGCLVYLLLLFVISMFKESVIVDGKEKIVKKELIKFEKKVFWVGVNLMLLGVVVVLVWLCVDFFRDFEVWVWMVGVKVGVGDLEGIIVGLMVCIIDFGVLDWLVVVLLFLVIMVVVLIVLIYFVWMDWQNIFGFDWFGILNVRIVSVVSVVMMLVLVICQIVLVVYFDV